MLGQENIIVIMSFHGFELIAILKKIFYILDLFLFSSSFDINTEVYKNNLFHKWSTNLH